MRLHHIPLGLLLASPALAQLQPGTHLVCAAVGFKTTTNNRGVYVVDRLANTQIRLTIQGINWQITNPRRTFIEDRKNFLLAVWQGTNQVYRVTWTGTAWKANLLTNTTTTPGFGPVLWEVTRIGKSIYMTTSSGGFTANNGIVWRMPATGGTPTIYKRLFNAKTTQFWGMPTAIATVGPVLHVFLWDAASSTRPKHLSINTAATTPTITAYPRWPLGKTQPGTCTKKSVIPTQAHYDPHTRFLVIGGHLGNILWRTTSGVTVRHDLLPPLPCSNVPRTQQGASLGLDSDTGAHLHGSLGGTLDEQLCRSGSWKIRAANIGGPQSKVAIQGIEYLPTGSLYREFGTVKGCKQSNGQVPCNYAMSLPTPGPGKRMRMAVKTPSLLGILLLGAKTTSLPLGRLGGKGCSLGVAPIVLVPASRTSTKLPLSLSFPMHASFKGMTLYTQWAVLGTAGNTPVFFMSGVRRMKP